MNKLKKKKKNNIINYQSFLKINNLKKKKIKLKNILFENQILLKNNEFNLIEINNQKTNFLYNYNNYMNLIFTIKNKYKNHLLYNYNLNYNLLSYFNFLILSSYLKRKKKIKSRVLGHLGRRRKKTCLLNFGKIFCFKRKKFFYKKLKKKNKKLYYRIKRKNRDIVNIYKYKLIVFRIKNYKNSLKKINNILYKNKKSFKKKIYRKKLK